LNQNFKDKLQDHLAAFAYNYLGKKPKSNIEKQEFARLLKLGLIKQKPVDSLGLLFYLGKAYALLGEVTKQWGKAEIVKFIDSEDGQLTRTEQASLDLLKAESEGYLEKLFTDVGANLQSDYNRRMLGSTEFKTSVKEALTNKVLQRRTLTQTASDIGNRTKVWSRDLYRIAFTESFNLYEMGTAFGYAKRTGKNFDEIRVAKIPRGRGISCKECLKLYLKPGTNEPKVFKLSDIAGNTNVGLKRKDWKPCLTAVHPYDQCHLVIVFPGQVWNPKPGRFEYPKKDAK
jgi:hypothetical protein